MSNRKDLLITGLPRSGTSFLCARINDFPNTVVINEPAEVFAELRGPDVSGISRLYTGYRSRIAAREPVPNKIRGGRFIEDTRLEDNRVLHVHEFENPDFTLGIKNTLVFMVMLPELIKQKGFHRVVASIRNPLDCIPSWHNVEFPHLKTARPEFLLNYSSPAFSKRIQNILAEDDLYLRSAMLWHFMAQILLSLKSRVCIVRYEDMINRPGKEFENIGNYLGFRSTEPSNLESSTVVRRRNDLTVEQKEKIRSVVGKLAPQFGYLIK